MICCILAFLLAGPLGVVLMPLRTGRDAGGACCTPRYVFIRGAAILAGVLLVSALVAAGLHFLDPPAFRHLCTFRFLR